MKLQFSGTKTENFGITYIDKIKQVHEFKFNKSKFICFTTMLSYSINTTNKYTMIHESDQRRCA